MHLGGALLILMVATSLNGYTNYMVQAMSAPQVWSVASLMVWMESHGKHSLPSFLLVCSALTGPLGRSLKAPLAPLPDPFPPSYDQNTLGVPKLNQNWSAFIFFVIFILFCALILLNLYTGMEKGVNKCLNLTRPGALSLYLPPHPPSQVLSSHSSAGSRRSSVGAIG